MFSIITVVFNAVKTIDQTINSVISQENKNYEYIIIDGGSTDGTLEIINKYSSEISFLSSERDSGIYDAMNKAINVANGCYLYFLGADDMLFDNFVLNKIAESLQVHYSDLIIGNVYYQSGTIIEPSFNKKLLLHNTVHHQGAFYHREIFKTFRYDDSLKLLADYELNLALFFKRKQIKVNILNQSISLCADDGASRSNLKLVKAETNFVRSKFFSGLSAAFLKIVFELKFEIWNVIRYKSL